MKIVKQLFYWLIPLFLTLGSSSTAVAQDAIDVSNTQEILITPVRAADRYRGRQKGDEALLIRDKSEIARFVKLFDKNVQAQVHACGYHWRLTFYRANMAATEIFFNEECEEFERNTEAICDIVQSKFRQSVNTPNRFLTNLEIDVNTTPESAKEILTSQAAMFVMMLHEIKRHPFVEIRASSSSKIPEDRSLWETAKTKVIESADLLLLDDLLRIREKYKVIDVGKIKHGMSMFGGGEIVEQRRMNIYFEIGTNLEPVGKLLSKSNVESMFSPTTYSLQILTEGRLTKSEQEMLQKRFFFVKTIKPYRV